MPDPQQRTIEVDGVTHVFPAGTSDEDISAALNTLPKRTFLGTEDFTGRMSRYAKPFIKSTASTIAAPLLHPLDTATNLIKGVGRAAIGAVELIPSAIEDPSGPAPDMGILSDTGRTIRRAVQGDPTAMGQVVGGAAIPRVYGGTLRMINQWAETLANSPAAQRTAGYIGGAGAGVVGGAHPFIMGRIGQAAAPIIGAGARGVAGATGSLMDILGMKRGATSPVDPYMPNRSGYSPEDQVTGPSEHVFQAEHGMPTEMPQGPTQGVYVKLDDGTWGVRALPGHELTEGQSVNIMSRAGTPRMHTVGPITQGIGRLTDGPPLEVDASSFPTREMVGGKMQNLSELTPSLREIILRELAQRQKP